MRELAHAQATSSSVLSELGGRLSTGAGTNWSSQPGGSHGEEGLLHYMAWAVVSRVCCILVAVLIAGKHHQRHALRPCCTTARAGCADALPPCTLPPAAACAALQCAAASCAGLPPARLPARAYSTASSAPRQHSALQPTWARATAPCHTGPLQHAPCMPMAPLEASAACWPTQSFPLTHLQGHRQARAPLL